MITIQILQLMFIQGDWTLIECAYFNTYLMLTKTEGGSSLLDLSDLAELLIVKNSIASRLVLHTR